MANYCDYEIRVKGSRNAGLMVFESMPCYDYKEIDWEKKLGGSQLLSFSGNCKWSVNFGVQDTAPDINVDAISEDDLESRSEEYWGCSLRAKSEAFQCEIMAHYWSEESGFDQFDHYDNGVILKQRKIACDCDEQNEFDWDKLEFVGHEGEYDESVDGEQQAADFVAKMMSMFGVGAPAEQESEISEDQATLADLSGQLSELMDQLNALAEEAGIDINASSIGNTDFDMYDWTFNEGTREEGDGWSIAIPDGFKVIDSKDGRLFEAVPMGMEDEDVDSIPIRILPGAGQPANVINEENWTFHPYARAGVAEAVAVHQSRFMAKLLGTVPEILSTGFSDVCAYVMVQDTGGGSYSYQIVVVTYGKTQQLRVQTQVMLDEQKKRLNKAVLTWIETFRFDEANPCVPKQCPLEDPKVMNELKAGKTASFEAAVERAKIDYAGAVSGRLETINFLAEYGLLDADTPDTVREILTRGMEVKEFYYKKADALVTNLKSANTNPSLMKKVYEKLGELKDSMTEIQVDDQKVTVELPAEVQKLMEKWKAGAAEADKAEKAAQLAVSEEVSHKNAVKAAEEYLRNEKEAQRQKSAIEKEINAYYQKSSDYFRNFCSEWSSFTGQIGSTVARLVREGITPNLSSGSNSISISFSANTDAAEKYSASALDKVKRKNAEYHGHIKEVDRKLEYFKDNGADIRSLANHLCDMVDYIPKLSFDLSREHRVDITIPDEISAIRNKWKNAPKAAQRDNSPKTAPDKRTMLEVNKLKLKTAEENYSKAKSAYEKAYAEFRRESELNGKLKAEANELIKLKSAAKEKLSEADKKLNNAKMENEQAVSNFKNLQKKLKKEAKDKANAVKEEQVRAEVFEEVAEAFKKWASKGGSKSKKQALYSAKQAAADNIRASVKSKLDELDEINSKIADEEAQQKKLEDSFALQKKALEGEVKAAKTELDDLEARITKADADSSKQAKTVDKLRDAYTRQNTAMFQADNEKKKLLSEIERLEAAIKGGK